MNGNNQLRGRALFEIIVSRWYNYRIRNRAFTLNQIAHLALGIGTSQNAGIIGRTLNEFIAYFHAPRGPARKWQVNWERVQQDYPDLFDPATAQILKPTPLSPLKAMNQALTDEIMAVQREMHQHPVMALGAVSLGTAGEGSFLYEAFVELPDGDSDLSIPEGVGIRLRWHVNNELNATLLSYDSLKLIIIFEVERPLDQWRLSRNFIIIPRVDELLKVVQSKLKELGSNPDALSWRLLQNGLVPQQRYWAHPLDGRKLDSAQFSAIRKCLNQDITFLWGPPGTGKTYTLARLMAMAALGGQKIAAVAIANVAVDQMAMQLVRALEDCGREGKALLDNGSVLRFGHPRLSEVSGEARLFPNKREIQYIRKQLHEARQRLRTIPQRDAQARALCQKHINDLTSELRKLTKTTIEQAQIVLTTAVQICLEPALTETRFNMMVVDEASMMPIPYLACMGMVGKERLIITGDFRQLGPIAVSRSAAAFDWLHKDAFELAGITCELPEIPSHRAMAMLKRQRRMHPKICDLVNKAFYGGQLETDTQNIKIESASLPPLPGVPAVFVLLEDRDGSRVEQTQGGSRYNQESAKVVVKLAKKFVQLNQNIQVGVITPYRAQVALIKRLLKDDNLPNASSDQLKVGTVHAFQGSEADVVIWDLVDTIHNAIGKPYQGDTGNRLTNVAITRARGKLVLIGDPNAFFEARGANMVRTLKNILRIVISKNVTLARKLVL